MRPKTKLKEHDMKTINEIGFAVFAGVISLSGPALAYLSVFGS